MTPPTVAVIGGGITGLSAALTLGRKRPDLRVVLFERSERLGGKLHTIEREGVRFEAGADSFIVRDGTIPDPWQSLGVEGELIEPAIFGGNLWDGRSLSPLPSGTIFGVPASARAVLTSTVLSPAGRLRALADLVLPGPLRGPDVSVAALVRRRFGAQVLDRMVDPILAGTRAGSPEEMSLAASLPSIDQVARRSSSIMRGLPASTETPRFLTHRNGTSALVEALAAACRADTRLSTSVNAIELDGTTLKVAAGGAKIRCAGAIVCVPADTSADLLKDVSPAAASDLASIRHASVASLTFCFSGDHLGDAPGSGLLVPSTARDTILSAATWWSRKWPHAVPEGRSVIRAFVGRAGRHPALALTDEALSQSVLTALRGFLPSLPEPLFTAITRWPNGMPQYDVGHLDRIARIEGSLPAHVAVAGADLRGSGIPDCLAQGDAAARRVAAAL